MKEVSDGGNGYTPHDRRDDEIADLKHKLRMATDLHETMAEAMSALLRDLELASGERSISLLLFFLGVAAGVVLSRLLV